MLTKHPETAPEQNKQVLDSVNVTSVKETLTRVLFPRYAERGPIRQPYQLKLIKCQPKLRFHVHATSPTGPNAAG